MSRIFYSPELSADEDEETLSNLTPLASLESRLGLLQNIDSMDMEDFPMPSSEGPVRSSPIVGTRQERAEHRKQKARKKQVQTLAQQQATKAAAADLKWKTDVGETLDLLLEVLKRKNLRFGDLMTYVFDPDNGQGTVRWHEFFVHKGASSQMLNWWMSPQNSKTVRREVHDWAVNYTAKHVAREARAVTKKKILQTIDKTIDYDFVSSFSFPNLYHSFQNKEMAPVSMRLLEAFSTSPKAKTHTPARQAKTQMVVTSAALACLGEYSHANNLAKRIIGLYLYATGAQRQSIAVLSSLGLSESYTNLVSRKMLPPKKRGPDLVNQSLPANDPITSTLTEVPPSSEGASVEPPSTAINNSVALRSTSTLRQLSTSMQEKAREIAATGLFGTVYDNININFSVAEQVVGRHGISSIREFQLSVHQVIYSRFTRKRNLRDDLPSF